VITKSQICRSTTKSSQICRWITDKANWKTNCVIKEKAAQMDTCIENIFGWKKHALKDQQRNFRMFTWNRERSWPKEPKRTWNAVRKRKVETADDDKSCESERKWERLRRKAVRENGGEKTVDGGERQWRRESDRENRRSLRSVNGACV
jgi:hypothetical protein